MTDRRNGKTDGITWGIWSEPVTLERPVPIDLQDKIPNPGLPRANCAPSAEEPDPTSTGKYTVAQAHVDYFDFDKDGIIWPQDTWRGFHNIGFNWFLSILAVIIIHLSFSFWSSPSWVPDPRLPIYVKGMHKCKHGSDTEAIDTEGRFIPEKFEEIFSKYAKKDPNALSAADIVAMIKGNRNIMDPVGWGATTFEWGALFYVARDSRGLLTKDRVRASYDGTLWEMLAREQKQKRSLRKDKAAAKQQQISEAKEQKRSAAKDL